MTDLEHLIEEIPADYREVWTRSAIALGTVWATRRDIVRSQEVIRKLRAGEPITRKDAGRLLGVISGIAYMVGSNVYAGWSSTRSSVKTLARVQRKARKKRSRENRDRQDRADAARAAFTENAMAGLGHVTHTASARASVAAALAKAQAAAAEAERRAEAERPIRGSDGST